MDDAARNKSLEQRGGQPAVSPDPDPSPSPSNSGAAAKIFDHLDQWRIHLVDLVYLLNAAFQDAHYWVGVKTEKDTFEQFMHVLGELDRLPGHDGVIRIRHRGSAGGKVPDKIDYHVQFAGVSLDLPIVSRIISRMGIRVKHLEGRLTQTFKTLSRLEIRSITISLPAADAQSMDQLKTALQIIAGYHEAVEKQTSIVLTKSGKKIELTPVLNAAGYPDPNLTLMAGLNGMGPQASRELTRKVAALRRSPKLASSRLNHLSVYQTIFAVKALREKLVRPPIEVNADPWPAAGQKHSGTASSGRGGGSSAPGPGGVPGERSCTEGTARPQPIMGRAAGKAEIASYVKETFGGTAGKAAAVMKSIYGKDFCELTAHTVGDRLTTLAGLLTQMEKSEKGRRMMDAVAGQIESALAQLPVELLDDIAVADSEVRIWDEESSRAVARINERLSGIISATRIRSAAERRKRTAVDWEQGLTEEDYDLLAKKHKTTRDAAKAICRLFEKCFDDRGNFQRPAFEQQAPAFADHPGRVFEILWEFLTVASRRSDRLPLLNSFQLLNERVQQPVKVIRFLLSDFAGDSKDIRFPDRNAMMLMIQMLRTYNKERHMDIEITPEEVLQVKKGLDRKVAAYTAWRVDTDHDRILAKIVTVRKSLVETLESGAETAWGMAFRFLLALERELHMFLALCGGGSAATVVRGSLNIYGDPDSELYKIDGSAVHLASLMQHLSVLIRSMARLGEADDIGALAEIGSRRQGFERLEDTARHRASVRRVLSWTDPAISEIKARLAAGR